ncbi:MAG: rod shape-determining protein MreC [Nitrospirae bacterium]|nr:MAG: rod shape-determining protein MreC [Nitrospirota bacterium]
MFNKRIFLLFIFLFGTIALMVFQSTKKPLKGPGIAQKPVLWIDRQITSLKETLSSTILSYKKLKQENQALRKQNLKLKLLVDQLEEMLYEKERIKALKELEKRYSPVVTLARVISMGIRPWPRVIEIDRGRLDGVKKNMAVVTVDGLAGKVIEVFDRYARVLLITDTNFSASVRIKETRVEGIISGTGTEECTLKYISKDEELKEGMTLVTSGLDRLFPKGIPVGIISSVEGADELFYIIKVKPFVKLNRIENVMVLGKVKR